MDELRNILLALDEQSDGGVLYLKAREVAEQVGTTPRAVGARFCHIRVDGDIPVEVEPWSKSAGCSTYQIEVDSKALKRYLRETRGESEPTLKS